MQIESLGYSETAFWGGVGEILGCGTEWITEDEGVPSLVNWKGGKAAGRLQGLQGGRGGLRPSVLTRSSADSLWWEEAERMITTTNKQSHQNPLSSHNLSGLQTPEGSLRRGPALRPEGFGRPQAGVILNSRHVLGTVKKDAGASLGSRGQGFFQHTSKRNVPHVPRQGQSNLNLRGTCPLLAVGRAAHPRGN